MWVYDGVVRQITDPAGKHRVWVSFVNGAEKQVIGLKFQAQPTSQQIVDAANIRAMYMNNQPPPSPIKTIEQLKEEIVEKDITISQLRDLREQIRAIADGPGTALQKLQAIRDLLNASTGVI